MKMPPDARYRGRGASINPTGRFEKLALDTHTLDALDESFGEEADKETLKTDYFVDKSKTLITYNQSPDVGFDASINPYRGCEHGCIYCYARPNHEYLGLSAGLDFESKIFVKQDAPEILARELGARTWRPQVVGISGVTDAYQPIERHLEITRRCLKVFADCRNPVTIITKSSIIRRDIDYLKELANHDAVSVYISVTTLDHAIHAKMEPRAATPTMRLGTIKSLATAGIPVGVLIGPVIPGLTDHELPKIVAAAADHGAKRARFILLRLPYGIKDLFNEWLGRHFPLKQRKVLNLIQQMRGGRLNDSTFKQRMRGQGIYAEQMRDMFHIVCRKHGLNQEELRLSTAFFRRPGLGDQADLQQTLW